MLRVRYSLIFIEAVFCGFTIRVNILDSTVQKRLAVAHEIAHFLRHRNRIKNRLVDDRMYRSRLDSTKEREAEELAYDLLMPRALIRELRASGINSASTLAERFQVPLHITRRRLGIKN
jgi:Zn-dependent peptidase ImmA (M78 family)